MFSRRILSLIIFCIFSISSLRAQLQRTETYKDFIVGANFGYAVNRTKGLENPESHQYQRNYLFSVFYEKYLGKSLFVRMDAMFISNALSIEKIQSLEFNQVTLNESYATHIENHHTEYIHFPLGIGYASKGLNRFKISGGMYYAKLFNSTSDKQVITSIFESDLPLINDPEITAGITYQEIELDPEQEFFNPDLFGFFLSAAVEMNVSKTINIEIKSSYNYPLNTSNNPEHDYLENFSTHQIFVSLGMVYKFIQKKYK